MEAAMSEEEMIDRVKRSIREYIDDSGYGGFISDSRCIELAEKIVREIRADEKGE
jgi:hypothetical protein